MTFSPLATLLLALSVWMTPLPRHASGRLVWYGPQSLVELNATYRGYNLSLFRDRCGVAVMSPADLGKVIWLRLPGGEFYGPCLSIDVAGRDNFLHYVNDLNEVAEIATPTRAALGITDDPLNPLGEVYVGACPPEILGTPLPYRVTPEYTTDSFHPSLYPYPPQAWPVSCAPKDNRR